MNEQRKLQRVLIMAGGTGGHVFPGLALAKYLREQGVDVQWLGTQHGLEAKLVPEAALSLHCITIHGLRGKGILPLFSAPLKIIKAIYEAIRIMKRLKPNVVIGLGGFVSGPSGVAAWLMRYPLIIHEQNAKAGLTNQLLSRLAQRVLEGFPGTFPPQAKVVAVGNPVRKEIENISPPEIRLRGRSRPFRLLVLGGSLGAQSLNDIVPRALSCLAPEERPEIQHQTGDRNFTATHHLYEKLGMPSNLIPFIKDMAYAYTWADMVLCRAGALTVAELCTAGVGAILVPYPYAVDDHQTINAEFMVKHSAALCFQQNELTEQKLAQVIRQFNDAPEQRLSMAKAAYRLRRIDVVKEIFEISKEICH